jgi:hypothetical protein
MIHIVPISWVPSPRNDYPTKLIPLIKRLEAYIKYLENDHSGDCQELQKMIEKYEAALQVMRDKQHVKIKI